MRKFILSVFFSVVFVGLNAAEYQVASPDGKVQAKVVCGTSTKYSLSYDGQHLIVDSPLSMTLSDGTVLEDTYSNHIYNGFIKTVEFSNAIIEGLKDLITNGIKIDQMTGIVGISDTVAATNGIKQYIYIMAIISVSLGITNLLPIPALDGGKLVILIIEAIRGKPLKQEIESAITLLGFSLLIVLSIYVTYNDILRIF